MRFQNRTTAGQQLAKLLHSYVDKVDVIVLALPRGGVPVAFEVAQYLQAPLSVVVSRKVGVPSNPEFGLGAVAESEVVYLEPELQAMMGVSQAQLEPIIQAEQQELRRRVNLYRSGRELPELANKQVILVDDGIATGVTVMAAIQTINQLNPAKLVVASPVCAQDTAERLTDQVDELVCIHTPPSLGAIGAYYHQFEQTTDEQVLALLATNTQAGNNS